MKAALIALLVPSVLLTACVPFQGENGQSVWRSGLEFAAHAVKELAPEEPLTASQLTGMLNPPDEVVSTADFLARIPDPQLRQTLASLAIALDRGNVRTLLHLGTATADASLPGEWWLYEEPLHFSHPMPPGIVGMIAVAFYVKDGLVGDVQVVNHWSVH